VLCSARISSGKPEPQSFAGNHVKTTITEFRQQHSGDAAGGGGGSPVKCCAKTTGGVNRYTHDRMSSVESTTSDDSSVQYAVNAEQPFGSISSLASSTSLISQHELQQLIDDANQTSLEENGGGAGTVTAVPPLPVEVMVVILHRDMATSSVGITLAGGADYETKEITVSPF